MSLNTTLHIGVTNVEILGRAVSEETNQIIENLCSAFTKPVLFHDISDLPNRPGFGAISSSDPQKYDVYLDLKLPQDAFEVNILHELFHGKQIESGYPLVCNKLGCDLFYTGDKAFFEHLGSQISVVVLDLDVIEHINKINRSNDYFLQSCIHEFSSFDPQAFNFGDKYNVAGLACQIALLLLSCDETDKQRVNEILHPLPEVLKLSASNITTIIGSFGFSTPISATQSLGGVIDYFGLWNLYRIFIQGRYIRTSKEYKDFRESL